MDCEGEHFPCVLGVVDKACCYDIYCNGPNTAGKEKATNEQVENQEGTSCWNPTTAPMDSRNNMKIWIAEMLILICLACVSPLQR